MAQTYKPILFSGEMVRAILDGRKTMTRRIVKFPKGWNPTWTGYIADRDTIYGSNNIPAVKAPYRVGDILWVRETWGIGIQMSGGILYRANYDGKAPLACGHHWRPSIYMPKAAARIFLRVADVRGERLHEITEEDAKAEGANWQNGQNVGLDEKMRRTAVDRFADLWDSLNAKRGYGWDVNPWVWAITFERVDKPAGWPLCR